MSVACRGKVRNRRGNTTLRISRATSDRLHHLVAARSREQVGRTVRSYTDTAKALYTFLTRA
jgi:hypothetical protein